MLLSEDEVNIRDIKKMKGGYNSEIYSFNLCSRSDYKGLVLKIYKNPLFIHDTANEYNILLDLKNKEFKSVPTVVKFKNITSTSPCVYLLMEKVKGITLRNYLTHATAPNIQIVIGKLVSTIKEYNALGYQHNDAKTGNFIFDGNKIFLLDWQCALKTNGPPFEDVTNLFYSLWDSLGIQDIFRKKGRRIAEQFLREYLRTEKLPLTILNQYLTKFGARILLDIKTYINPLKFTKKSILKYILLAPFIILYFSIKYVAFKKFIAKLNINDFYS